MSVVGQLIHHKPAPSTPGGGREKGRERQVTISNRCDVIETAEILGHVMRREDLENLIMTGMVEGVRGRGGPRVIYMDGLA